MLASQHRAINQIDANRTLRRLAISLFTGVALADTALLALVPYPLVGLTVVCQLVTFAAVLLLALREG